MGLLRAAAHAIFGDRVPSNEERVLRRQAKQLRRRAKWANRLSKDTAATRMLNQQAIQLALAYETIREQRYRRLAALYTTKKCECKVARYLSRAGCSRAVMVQLQQQLLAYQPPQQYNMPLDSPPQYAFYPGVQQQQQQQQQQQHQSPAAVAAMPVTMQSAAANQALPAPPAYSGPAFAHYPTVFQWSSDASSPTSVSSNSSLSSVSSSASSQSQLQEPWLKQGEKQTVY